MSRRIKRNRTATKNPKLINVDWNIHYVFMEDAEEGTYADIHTHGLNNHGLPELCLVIAIHQDQAADVLNTLAMRAVAGDIILHEGVTKDVLADGYRCRIIRFKGENKLYIILPDENNRLPGEPMCMKPFCGQIEYAKKLHDKYVNGELP